MHRVTQATGKVDHPTGDFVIATFAEGGVSTTRWQESFRQFHAARISILRPSGALAIRERWNTATRPATKA
jgi:hypothetical protein